MTESTWGSIQHVTLSAFKHFKAYVEANQLITRDLKLLRSTVTTRLSKILDVVRMLTKSVPAPPGTALAAPHTMRRDQGSLVHTHLCLDSAQLCQSHVHSIALCLLVYHCVTNVAQVTMPCHFLCSGAWASHLDSQPWTST
jgi:hypothetical protein